MRIYILQLDDAYHRTYVRYFTSLVAAEAFKAEIINALRLLEASGEVTITEVDAS